MRYASRDNFTGKPLPGYDAPECLLREAAARALRKVQADLAAASLSLKVYDCYRPQRAVAAMAAWSRDGKPAPASKRFYPALDKANLFALGYIAARSAHSRGVAVDLTVVPRGSAAAAFDPAARYGPAPARRPNARPTTVSTWAPATIASTIRATRTLRRSRRRKAATAAGCSR